MAQPDDVDRSGPGRPGAQSRIQGLPGRQLKAATSGPGFAALRAGFRGVAPPNAEEQRMREVYVAGVSMTRFGKFPGVSGGQRSFFMDIYAGLTRDYMARSRATAIDFAQVVVKNQRHGALNPKAQYGGLFSVDDVLASRVVSSPLTLLMCSPIGDGSA